MIRNRRHFARYVANTPIHVCLGAISGFLHNLGQGGLAADVACESDGQVIAIGLGAGNLQIEANAQIVWRDDSKNRIGLKFVDLSETTRQQVKQLLCGMLIGDTPEAGIATKQRFAEPQLMKSLFTASSLATSEEALSPRDSLRIEETDEDVEPLADVRTRALPPTGGWIWLGSLLLVALVAFFLFPDTTLFLWSDLTSTDIDSFSSSTTEPPSSPASPVASASSDATIPAAASASSADPPTLSSPADATRIQRIEVFRTHEQTNVRIIGNGQLFYNVSRLSDPERLVLDFSRARIGFLQTSVLSNSKPVRGIRMSQFKPDVARVVVDLEGAVPYGTRSDDNSLTIAFTPLEIVRPSVSLPHSKATKSQPLSVGDTQKNGPNGSP